MHYIRRAHADDLDALLKLAKTVHFINLPADKDIIADKIARSRASFIGAQTGAPFTYEGAESGAGKDSPLFMFVLADAETDTCHGTSTIIARMGQPGHPNLSFELRKREFFSRDLQTGTTHTTAKLYLDESGPSELGGLIMSPALRGHPGRLGKQISLIRFHYAGLHPEQFSDHMIAEMMAPLTPDGRSLFWEALGRKFINLSYAEADRFCQHSREFMMNLLPREEIYLSLLPPEARQVVGEVGADTRPARRMLEAIGFKHTGRVDPFDGGPHIEAKTADISLVRATAPGIFAGTCTPAQAKLEGFVSVELDDGEFRALHTAYAQTEAGGRAIKLPKEAAGVLMLEAGMPIALTPVDLHGTGRAKAAAQPAPKKRRSKASKASA